MHRPSSPRRPIPNRPLLRCEQLEDRITPSVAAEEQLFVYLLNLARHDPSAYQTEQALPVSLAGIASQPPLAVNDQLFDSTEFHAQDMADRNYFDHNTPEGLTPNEMVRNADYTLNPIFWPTGNNVESIAGGTNIDTAQEALNLLLVDAGVSPPAHRIQLLAMVSFFQDHREIGVGHAFNSTSDLQNYWAIHTAYTNSSDKFLTGVVYNDLNANHRYDLNEGLAGVTVTVGGQTTTTNDAGGWSIKVAGSGNMIVTASGGGFSGPASSGISVGSSNVEVDFISGRPTGIVNFAKDNSAPILNTALSPTLPTIREDDTNPSGAMISTLADAGITDPDVLALKGIAVTSVDNTNGQWQYSVGAGWQNFGVVSDANARLLRDTDRIRFVPDANFHGNSTFTFRAWDRTSGVAGGVGDATINGGTSAFSAAADSAGITVLSVNDAPILASGISFLPAINVNTINPAGVTVGALAGAAITDADDGALQGIAIIGSTNASGGVWQYSLNGGSTWKNLGVVSGSAARLLDASDLVRFVPATNYTLTSAAAPKPSLTFRAWDETSGVVGGTANIVASGGATAFSSGIRLANIIVNDAPTLGIASANLPQIAEDSLTSGATAASFADAFIGDTGNGTLKGIAVTSVDNSNGTWQYFTGTAWLAIGSPSDSAARLLRDTDRIRFVPAKDFNGTATFTFRAWDRTVGTAGGIADASATGGTTAFSTAAATGSITVTPVNDAPVLAAGSPSLPDVLAGDPNPAGVTVATLAGASISDVDAGALTGIAIIGQTGTINGTWQFSTDGGANWSNIGAVSGFSARLLADNNLVRFLPNPTYTMTTALSLKPTITFRAWDQTVGVAGSTASAASIGGKTAFSIGTETAKVRVNAAPTLTPTSPALGPVGTGSPFIITVSSLLGSSVTDVGTGTLRGIAVTGLTAVGSGHWQYSIGGGAFIDFGAVSDASARLLRAGDRLRYVPQAGQTGSATISYHAWDQTSGFAGLAVDASATGGTTAFSAAADTATLTLT